MGATPFRELKPRGSLLTFSLCSTTTTRAGKRDHEQTVETGAPSTEVIQEMPTAANRLTPPTSQVFDSFDDNRHDNRQPPPVQTGRAPDVPERSPNRMADNPYRVSQERMTYPVSPVDPPAQNFSYPHTPQRHGEGLDLAGNPVSSRTRGSTFENLKQAAVGIHVCSLPIFLKVTCD